MRCINYSIFLVFIASHQALGNDPEPYAASGFNKLVSSKNQGVSVFGPSPLVDLNLEVNNLQVTSLANDKRYLYFAFAAYCSEETLKNWDCGLCKILESNIRFITEIVRTVEGTKAYLAVDSGRSEIVLVFRGSFNAGNFASDFTLVPLRLKNGSNTEIRLHTGFYTATLSLYNPVVEELRNLIEIHPSFKVIITGHSLGGAQSSITMFLLKFYNVFPETQFELYTYGAPRHGNRAYATYFNSLDIPAARVVHSADMAVHAMAYSMGFVHHQNEVWEVSPENVWKNCSRSVYEDQNCSDSQAHLASVVDHLYYFGVDVRSCSSEDPAAFLFQVPVNLRRFISTELVPRWPVDSVPGVADFGIFSPAVQRTGK